MGNALDPGTTPEESLFQWSPNNPINGVPPGSSPQGGGLTQ
jgi:hypothetical protein